MKRVLSLISACIIPMLILLAQQGTHGRIHSAFAAATLQTTDDSSVHIPFITGGYSPKPLTHFGLQTYGSTTPDSRYYPYLIGSQASWLRVSLYWHQIEPDNIDPPEYRWASSDTYVSVAMPSNGGLNLIGTIESMPLWASLTGDDPHGRIHPDAMDDFAQFLRSAVERYDGDGYQDAPGRPIVRYWELFNEPDNIARWGPYGTEYAEMLKVAYQAIKSADPNAQVLLGGLAYDWFVTDAADGQFDPNFLPDVLAAGGGAYFDIMNFHTYPVFSSYWNSKSTGLIEKTAAIRAELAAHGLSKPVVITESGWHNGANFSPSSSDAEQVARLVQLYAQGLAADIEILVWFMITDPESYMPPYGLVTSDDPPVAKLAYFAYQTAVDQLGGATFVRKIPPNETGNSDLVALQFSKDGARFYVAWMDPYGADASHPLRIPGKEATLISGTGQFIAPGPINENPVIDRDGDGYINVNIRSQPIYIQITSP